MLKLTVQEKDISLLQVGDEVYVSLTDIVKNEDGEDHIRNWMRNRNTLEFLGLWEQLNNPDFKGVEFDTFKKEAGLNSFNMTPKKWIEGTNAKGIISKAGRIGGGTFAHKDLALEFCTWLSPMFKLLVLKEFQRLKEITEIDSKWDIRRYLSKVNYKLQTDAIKEVLIPISNLSKDKEGIIYANEADVIYVAMYGYTSKQWREKNPDLSKQGLNIRDTADTHQLIILSNLETLNSNMIKNNKPQNERLVELRKEAISQKKSLSQSMEPDHKLIKSPLIKQHQKKMD